MNRTLTRFLFCFAPAALALGWSAPAGAAALPATGQTAAYTANRNDGISAAVAVPDDGTLRAGAQSAWAVPAAFFNHCVPGVSAVSGSCATQTSYWTSTSQTSNTLNFTAWYGGPYGDVYPTFKSSGIRARAVRGGSQ